MEIGDAALAAGMDVVDGNATQANTLDDEINKTRDYIATHAPDVVTVDSGGTGATTAAQARVNLGVQGAVDAVTAASATSTEGKLIQGGAGGRINVGTPTTDTNAATKGYVDGRVGSIDAGVPASGGTFTGQVYFPNATTATSGYTVGYINGDGRLAKGASSERYKKYISTITPASLGDLWPNLTRYQIKGGDGSWKYGYIAERLNESDDLRPFVVFDDEGLPDSIDFIALLMAQNAQLNERVKVLEAS